ncbi:hypothetical protein M6D93_16385 [Jatrophihabitans telluris]|uniref:Uncharacterized protein n=1 Tax=Jatrophihabitans telluris TaxID=2038343 RepID=A0ABY4QWI2_9ACTN|nr:hypothetical protein [Jatrophihabitans telluris]UQX87865.1 hypothetical protein M6D93_16385 [Jatrophihabitans telluris]
MLVDRPSAVRLVSSPKTQPSFGLPDPLCACGHSAESHRHFRRGSDCGRCGSRLCGRYQAFGAGAVRAPHGPFGWLGLFR